MQSKIYLLFFLIKYDIVNVTTYLIILNGVVGMNFREINEILQNYPLAGEVSSARAHGSGHINDTFLVTCKTANGAVKYTLQRINHHVFPHPDEVMENIVSVTEFLRKKILAQGGNPERGTLSVVLTKDGKNYVQDKNGGYWRVYPYIDHAMTFNLVSWPEDFYKCGYAVGNFMMLLSDYPAATLHETIENFHNTPKRYENLMNAVAKNAAGRADTAAEEIAFAEERRAFTTLIEQAHKDGKIPLRVTHNDTKLNNVLFDRASGDPICLIDLDTIMPGYSVCDFGDSIRVGANTAAEDEKELSLVGIDLELYEMFTKGYLEACGSSLTETEIKLLPVGAKMLTLECGMRFLTDYLDGDVYFKTQYAEHNLVRCRTQFKLVRSMEEHWEEMVAITEKYAAQIR